MSETLRKIIAYCLSEEKNITIKATANALRLSKKTAGNYLRGLLQSGAVKVTQVKPVVHYQIASVQERINGATQCLFVYKNASLTGYLYSSEDAYRFFYDLAYLAEPDAEAIFPLFPLKAKVFHAEILFPAFSQILPEGNDRRLLELKAGTADDFSLLAELAHNYGDLSFSVCATEQPKRTQALSRLHQEWHRPEIKQKILGQHDFPNVLDVSVEIKPNILFPESGDLQLASRGYGPSGLSGFQHKLSIMLADGKIRQARKNEHSEYFLKPYHKDRAALDSEFYFPHLALNEHLFMSFAKNELGFDVPWSALVKNAADEEYHYVVKRYDRYGAVKLAHIEFAPLLGLTSKTKYNISTDKLCKKIKPNLPRAEERLILLKYLFYSMLIVHEDMHTKNLSIMLEGGKNRMAPLYDVACTGIYQNANGYESHLPICGRRNNIRPKHFYCLANLLNVRKNKFQHSARKILDKYTNCLPIYLEKLERFPDAKIALKTRANMSGQTQSIVSIVTLQDALSDMHKQRVESLVKTGWYHELDLPAYQLATVDDIKGFKQEDKIIARLKLYRYCTKEVVELLANLQMSDAECIAQSRMKPE